jgi:integrase/recombinase XerD
VGHCKDRDQDSGKFIPKEAPKIRVDRFREHISAVRSAQTAYTYIAAVRRFEEFLDKNGILLKNAPSSLLDDFVVWMSKNNLSPATIRLTLSGVNSYTAWCRNHDDGGCPKFDEPKTPKIVQKDPFILNSNELFFYFKEVAKLKEPSRTALLIMPYCGLRVTELCRVELNRITSELDKKGKRWTVILVMGKGRKMRHIPLLPQASDMLIKYLNGWRSQQRKSKWLFPGKDIKEKAGRKFQRFIDSLSAKTLQAHLRNIRERMKLKSDLTPHVLRKTCFTYLYRQGMSIHTIAKIAGHESIETTMKYYIASSSRETLDELGGVVERQKK